MPAFADSVVLGAPLLAVINCIAAFPFPLQQVRRGIGGSVGLLTIFLEADLHSSAVIMVSITHGLISQSYHFDLLELLARGLVVRGGEIGRFGALINSASPEINPSPSRTPLRDSSCSL